MVCKTLRLIDSPTLYIILQFTFSAAFAVTLDKKMLASNSLRASWYVHTDPDKTVRAVAAVRGAIATNDTSEPRSRSPLGRRGGLSDWVASLSKRRLDMYL